LKRPQKIPRCASALLHWFSQNARDLPWRRTRDPYAIWVSEIMLQQTQVKTVIPYWERWLRELPTIQSLARATPDKIHKLWEGLGYYTRVRNLQKAAQQIIAHHGGQFPRAYDDILELPGIGRYTAGAIASIAFNEPKPILDGNIIRVLTRVFGIAENPREKATNQKLWRIANELVTTASNPAARIPHPASPSHLNQSLMELGALICTPRQPACLLCPVRPDCVAFRTRRVEQLPNLGERAASTSRRFAAFVVRHRGRFLVRQRPAGVVNAHLWEFPNLETDAAGADLQSLAAREFGLKITAVKKLCAIKHSITRYRITLEVFRVRCPRFSVSPSAGRWFTLRQLDSLAFTSAHRKILRLLAG
jgi:A/G-specific adenine glycosylase